MKYNFYCIENKENGKLYVGLTKRDIETRFREHIRYALSNKDLNHDFVMPFYNAIRKYGDHSFSVRLLETIDLPSYKDAEIYEGKLIREHKSMTTENGYNLNHISEDGYRKYVDEVSERIRTNQSGEKNAFYGKKHSEETRRILSEKAKNRFTDPTKNPRYGYQYTEEDKQRHRESKKKFGKPFYADGVLYQTLGDAARKYNLTKQAIKCRIDSKTYKDWYYNGN